jgi:hypothetical protein
MQHTEQQWGPLITLHLMSLTQQQQQQQQLARTRQHRRQQQQQQQQQQRHQKRDLCLLPVLSR